ncbi:colanic acid biosynthesis glycosyltransferase WcaL [Anaerohalosphaera lusitana]|uniref:Colanic acid biosynthesis glycosyltransferase WcaL n=1 Tax=Anaerohalosphaera lusitana TaxID=1936003 RepID=A0A1U9NPP5_9BACT|nr:glycosyltransferase family 4 protein [Anaerohalosphaera lusitana]AQT69757.1 colanic acid biosynthesis glycosyltransferase WcaL [Anaerohalosphaera lusitana]
MDNGSSKTSKSGKVPVRPAIFVDAYAIRDYATGLQHLLAGLAEKSHEAALVCPPDVNIDAVMGPTATAMCYPVFKLPFLCRQNRNMLVDRLGKFKPSVLHAFSSSRFKITRQVAHIMDLPYVLSVNRLALRPSANYMKDEHCTSVVASSRKISEAMCKKSPYAEEKLEQINIGTFVEDSTACFSGEHAVTSIILAQDLHKEQDFKALLNAIRHLVIDGYEFVLAILGKGKAERAIHRQIHSLELSQIITLVGEVEPIRPLFAGADVFIQPQPRREFNSRLLEAMSVGMAVATSRHIKDDMVIPDETAVVFDPYDELSVYSALQKILEDKDRARCMAQNGQDYLRKYHSVSRMADSLTDTYIGAQVKHKNLGAGEHE